VQCTVHRIPHQNVNDKATVVQISYARCYAILSKDPMTSQSASHVVPHPLKEVLHQTRRKLCQDLISSVDNNLTFMRNIITNDKAWCFMYDAQISGESTGWLITPSLFRKNWWNTTLLCYHICHILQTSVFQTFFSYTSVTKPNTYVYH